MGHAGALRRHPRLRAGAADLPDFQDRGPFTAQESKEALNFTLPPTIAAVLANILVLLPVVGNLFAVLATVIWIAVTCFSVAAGIHVNRGQPHRYEFNLRWIK